MTVTEYKALPHLSSSKLKLFAKNLWKFKKWIVDGIKPPQTRSKSITMGNLVDFKLLRDKENGTGEESFDDLFILYQGKKVSGQPLELAEELYDVTMNSIDDLGKINRTVESLLDEAIQNYAFDATGDQIKFKNKKSKEDIIAYFYEKGGFEYYKVLRDNTDKDVITLQDIEIAEKLVTNLRSHWTTRDIFLTTSSAGRTVINQFAHVFDYKGEKIKILIDKLIINHIKKTIYPFELKTTFDQEQFERNFIDLGYHFQLGTYTYGLASYAVEKKYTDYKVEPLKFIVCPTNFTQAPFQVHPDWEAYTKAINGFEYKGRKIKGVTQCVEEIIWHKANKIWDMDKEMFEAKGIRKLNFI